MTDDHECVKVTFCADHVSELRLALIERGMSKDLYLTEGEREFNVKEGGDSDVLTDLEAQIAIPALSLLGAVNVSSVGGCPVCAFDNIVGFAADQTAMNYVRKH